LEHCQTQQYTSLTAETKLALKTFILDSLGVGISGSRVLFSEPLKQLCQSWGYGSQAQAFNSADWYPAPTAAMLNAWQIHNQEFDCVHEPAVVHPMAVIFAALLAFAQRAGNINGQSFMTAISVAVDVATTLGKASDAPLTFFRPGCCGALGAVVGMAKLAGCDTLTTRHAFGITYSMLNGTMQAHTEGSAMLAMQIGIAARNAVNALDLALAGLDGPLDSLEGPFGFYHLFEPRSDLPLAIAELKHRARITEVSHKPFPTGRACHGGLDALTELIKQHQLQAQNITAIKLVAPPLIKRLIGRPATAGMSVSYARLCFGYSAASLLLDGAVHVNCYDNAKLQQSERLALAALCQVESDGSSDQNAMTPQTLYLSLSDGRQLQLHLNATLGSPQRPLTKPQQLEKFRLCCLSAAKPLTPSAIDALITQVDALEHLHDVSLLLSLSNPRSA